MGRKRKKTDYRRYYKDYFGIEFGPEMVVHHIDFDKANNNIDNLLLMPRTLHAKYHFCVTGLGGKDGTIDGNMQIKEDGYRIIYKAAMLRGLGEALEEIEKWHRKKMEAAQRLHSSENWDNYNMAESVYSTMNTGKPKEV